MRLPFNPVCRTTAVALVALASLSWLSGSAFAQNRSQLPVGTRSHGIEQPGSGIL